MKRRREELPKSHVPGDDPYIYAITLSSYGLSEYKRRIPIGRIPVSVIDPIDFGKELLQETWRMGVNEGKNAEDKRIVAIAVCDHLQSAAAVLPQRRPNPKYAMLRVLAGMSWVVQPEGAEPKDIFDVSGNGSWLEDAMPKDPNSIGGNGLSMGGGERVRLAILPSFYMGQPPSFGVTMAIRAQDSAGFGYNVGLVPRADTGFQQHLIPAGELALHGSGISF